jgi:hypothetical protein
MPPKSSSPLGRPHLGPEDFNEGPEAAARFIAACSHLFKVRPPKTKPKSNRKNGKRNSS